MPAHASLPHLFLAVIVAILWGFSFVFVKFTMSYFSPFLGLALRFGLVSLVLLPFYPRPPVSLWTIVKITTSFALLHLGFMFWSLYLGLDSSVGVVVEQLGIPFLLLLGVIFFKEKFTTKSIMGITLAIIGTYFLKNAPNSLQYPVAFCFMMASAFFWALYSIQIKTIKNVPVLGLITWISFLAFPVMLILSLLFENNQWEMLTTSPTLAWLAIGYSVFATSIVSHGLWYYLLARNHVHAIAPVTLSVPLFGVIGGIVFLGEPFSQEMLMGTLLMLGGIAIVLIRKPKFLVTNIDA